MSILLAGFFSYQMIVENILFLSIPGIVATLGLIYYMTLIVKKFKTI